MSWDTSVTQAPGCRRPAGGGARGRREGGRREGGPRVKLGAEQVSAFDKRQPSQRVMSSQGGQGVRRTQDLQQKIQEEKLEEVNVSNLNTQPSLSFLPETYTKSIEGLQEGPGSPGGLRRFQETSEDSRRPLETPGGFRRLQDLQEASEDYRRPQKTSGSLWRLKEASGDLRRPLETPGG